MTLEGKAALKIPPEAAYGGLASRPARFSKTKRPPGRAGGSHRLDHTCGISGSHEGRNEGRKEGRKEGKK